MLHVYGHMTRRGRLFNTAGSIVSRVTLVTLIRDSIERDWKLINQHQSTRTILGIHTMASRGVGGFYGA